MDVLIKKCIIVDPQSTNNGKIRDVLVEKGILTKIAKNIPNTSAKIVEGEKLHVSPGFVDVGAITGEPGEEHRDTLQTTLSAAGKGGFTQLCLMTNKHTPLDNASLVNLILSRTLGKVITCHVIGAMTQALEGKDLTEMVDMHEAGAIAFCDGLNSIKNDGLLSRALLYSKGFDGLIMHHPGNETFYQNAHIHEGVVSTSIGMTGIPSVAEAIMVERDIQLQEYTEGKLLLHLISTKEAVNKLKSFKRDNLFASVSYHNLIETDEDVANFDTNRKVLPPLREKGDRSSLLKAVKNGTIDMISSNHVPLDEEAKKKEFPYAEFGAIGLQTCILQLLEVLDPESIVRMMSINPRKILGLSESVILEGNMADLSIWDAGRNYQFVNRENASLSSNSPYLDMQFSNTVIGIINNKKNVLHYS